MTLIGDPVPTVRINPLRQARFFFNMANDFLTTQEDLFDEYGDIFTYTIMGTNYYPIRHPEHVRDALVRNAKKAVKDTDFNNPERGLSKFIGSGLLTSNGDFWKRQRKLVSPAFHVQRVSEYADYIVEETKAMVAGWEDGDEFFLLDEVSNLTHRIMSRTLFADVDPEDLREVVRDIINIQKTYLRSMMLPDALAHLLTDQFESVISRFDAIVYPIIDAYREHGEDRGDLLSMLLMVEGEDGDRMTDKEVRDEALSLLLAGHETTAATLCWATLLLGQQPNIRARLNAEVDAVLGGRAATLMDLRALPYTEQVMKEVMRIYPAAPIILRRAVEDITVGGYAIPEGGVLVISPYFTQHHTAVWDDPLTFDPERFADEKTIDKWAYFPFGGGPRVCMGQSFAQMEIQLVLATIAGQFELELPHNYRPSAQIAVTMYPKDKLPVIARRRVLPTQRVNTA